jgi:hypothetical protein
METLRGKLESDNNILALIQLLLTLERKVKDLRQELYFVWVMFFLLLMLLAFSTYIKVTATTEDVQHDPTAKSSDRAD